ncbi:MAG: hypothetical protein E7014_04520 [Alphaproteobacteria bacterium]|nr:hypothetical protein [Alphaproteobacteria bacterium]
MTIEKDCIFVKSLSGYSGCHVNLYRKNNQLFVRKSSGNPSYNNRLKKQFLKQKHFHIDKIKTPIILNNGYENNIFFFDMEFINGITLAEYMKQITIKEIVNLTDILFNSLSVNESIYCSDTQYIFEKKINSLQNVITLDDDFILKAFQCLKKFDFSNIPYSFCCGDLTLENIILSPKREIYIIDLLDSFYNSWLLDVAKLFQDLELGWSYRNVDTSYNLNLRLEVAKQAILERLKSMPNGDYLCQATYHILLLNILRIYLYATDINTIFFLNKSVKKVLTVLNKMR